MAFKVIGQAVGGVAASSEICDCSTFLANSESKLNRAYAWDVLKKLLRVCTPGHDAWSCILLELVQELADNIEAGVGYFKPVLATPMGVG